MSKSVRTRTRSAVAAGTVLGLAALPLFSTVAVAQPAEPAGGPKNIIMLISDGGGYNHFDAASLFEYGTTYGQVAVDPATGSVEQVEGTASQVYESYPVQVGLSHYPAGGSYVTETAWGDFAAVRQGATDSAAAGTALGTGVKTRNGILGFDADGNRLTTVGEQAAELGKSAGVVSSVPFNHATPAGFIAHNQDRNDYHGLATEMIDSELDVIMGGGHPNFTGAGTTRPADYRWISQDDFNRVVGGDTPYAFMDAKTSFEALAAGTDVPERVFGLAQTSGSLQYDRPGDRDDVVPFTDPANPLTPSLEVMTRGALNVLDQNEDGFFLMVESGAVDWAGHDNQTTRTVEEQVAFNEAVAAVDTWVAENSSWDETMVVVTADHETGYLAGPGADPTWTPMTGAQGELPDVSWHSGGHTNALVPLYAKGAGSDVLVDRAVGFDRVRGAYIDNTAVGQAVFDLMGGAYAGGDGTAALEAVVGRSTGGDDGEPGDPGPGAGALSLQVAPTDAPVGFTADTASDAMTAELPQVTIRDTRSEVAARGQGWNDAGSAEDFRAGNRTIGADNLSWVPGIVSSEAGAAAGPESSLAEPATLATADRVTRVGTTVVDADLALQVPADAVDGRYGSTITLTVFPVD